MIKDEKPMTFQQSRSPFESGLVELINEIAEHDITVGEAIDRFRALFLSLPGMTEDSCIAGAHMEYYKVGGCKCSLREQLKRELTNQGIGNVTQPNASADDNASGAVTTPERSN